MSHQASRKHYCTNKYVRDKENIDEEWCGVFFFFSKHINKILLSFSHDNYFFFLASCFWGIEIWVVLNLSKLFLYFYMLI